MGNVFDYVMWRGDLTFQERPFNEVDNLIFSQLVYMNFGEFNPSGRPITIREMFELAEHHEFPKKINIKNQYDLLHTCSRAPRFRDIMIYGFTDLFDRDLKMQFAACTFALPDGSIYVAFRGTDNTIVGWREDFDLSYMQETPAQAQASRYLANLMRSTTCPVRVGGHSKGGNLAMYAAAFSGFVDSPRLLDVYSNDGPGFNQAVVENPFYLKMLEKAHVIIPESSMIGIIFAGDRKKKIVKSSASGISQHNLVTWQVKRDAFETADDQSSVSQMLDKTIRTWMDSLPMAQRQAFVCGVFDALEATGAITMQEINEKHWESYNAIIRSIMRSPAASRGVVIDAVKKLATIGREVIWNERKAQFEQRQEIRRQEKELRSLPAQAQT